MQPRIQFYQAAFEYFMDTVGMDLEEEILASNLALHHLLPLESDTSSVLYTEMEQRIEALKLIRELRYGNISEYEFTTLVELYEKNE